MSSLLILTACGTPQEHCIGAATRDMRVVDRLIAEDEANICVAAMLLKTLRFTPRNGSIARHVSNRARPRQNRRCAWMTCRKPSPKPKRIDLDAEAAKLKSLKAKRAAQAKAAAPRNQSLQSSVSGIMSKFS